MSASVLVPSEALVVLAAFALDAWVGEPPNAFHPVVYIGRLIAPLTRLRIVSAPLAFLVGLAYVVLLLSGLVAAVWVGRAALAPWPWVRFAFDTYLVWSCFALRALVSAGARMRSALAAGDLARARESLSWLCSRDATHLTATDLAGASVESLTENTSDSVVAPLAFYAFLGLPGIVFYRTVNTFDAMVGYHGRFEYVGKFAARLDDVLNVVPARLTAWLLLVSGLVLRLDVRAGMRVWWRDHARTESPNAGHPMAMAAGLLGVQLDKPGAYVLGQGGEPADAAALARAEVLTKVAGTLACALTIFMLGAFGGPIVD